MPPEAPVESRADSAETPIGKLAAMVGRKLPLQVCQSRSGFYLGTVDDHSMPPGEPFTRESEDYWQKREEAARALTAGAWTQRRGV